MRHRDNAENEKRTGTVTLLDSATQEYEYQMKECHPPMIAESQFRGCTGGKEKTKQYRHK